jgi:hypothetical protein
LLFPLWPRGGYRIEGSFTANDEKKGLVVVTPFAHGRAAVELMANGELGAGLTQIRGKTWDKENPTIVKPARIVAGQRHTFSINCQVTGDDVKIEVRLDGDPYFQWQGPQADLSLHSHWNIAVPNLKVPAVGVDRTSIVFHELTLTPIGKPARRLREELPAK